MNTITAAQALLDQNENCSIWYAAYSGAEEAVLYANPLFCQTFGLCLEEIVARKRYHLVNPPETPAATIKQYIAEDQLAIERGYFLQRSAIEADKDEADKDEADKDETDKDETDKDILVLKIRFDQGVIGMFKIIDSNDPRQAKSPRDLDTDFRSVLESLRPDLVD